MVDRDVSLVEDYSSKMEERLKRSSELQESIFGEMGVIEECLDSYHAYKTSKLYGEISFPQYLVAKESAKEMLQTGMDLSRGGVSGSAYSLAGEGEQAVSSDNNLIGHKGDFLFERTRAGAASKQSREKAEKLNELLAFSNANKNSTSSAANAGDIAEGGAAKPVVRATPAPRLIAVTSLLSKVQALGVIDNDNYGGGGDDAD